MGAERPPETHVSAHDLMLAILRELHGISHTLDQGERTTDYDPSALAITDDPRALRTIEDFPIRGGQRHIVGRQGLGVMMATPAPGAPAVDVLPANAARMGLYAITSGANPNLLYLGSAERVNAGEAVPRLLLPAGGPPWVGLIGNVMWAGALSVVAFAAGASQVIVSEI